MTTDRAAIIEKYQRLEAEKKRQRGPGRQLESRADYVLRLGRIMRLQSDMETRYPWLLDETTEEK